jgi:hypothetical protein
MSAQATLEKLNIEETLDRILTSEKITISEQRWLILLSLEGNMNREQAHLANKVYEALRNGLLAIIHPKNQSAQDN